jgi:biotin carboxylase
MPSSGNPDGGGARPHVLVIHRWRDRYAHYETYVDHSTSHVTYVTTDVGTPGVPPTAAAVEVVRATDDLAEVRAAAGRLTARFGRPAAVVALKEDDLLVAARLRAEWNLPGPTEAELLPFRDKREMTRRVAEAGLPVPASAAVSAPGQVTGFAARHGWTGWV